LGSATVSRQAAVEPRTCLLLAVALGKPRIPPGLRTFLRNRDDFIKLAETQRHRGIVVIIRRKTRAAERAALLRLLERAGESGLKDNITFA
jgi:hypothetical protein